MAGYSIIIPTLNEAGWLPALLCDIEALALCPSEVIVVDGHSEDATVALAQQHPLVRVVTSTRGIAVQRNTGAKSANNNILLFLDADASLNTKSTALLIRHLLRTNADIVLPFYAVPQSAHWSVKVLFSTLSAMIWFSQWGPIPAGGGQCVLIKRSAFEKLGGFDERLRITEDLDLIRRAGREKLRVRVANIPITVSDRRFTKENRLPTIWLYIKVSWWFVFNRHHIQTANTAYSLGKHQQPDVRSD